MKQSIDVHYIYSTNCPVEFNSVFTYSLPAGSISFWYRQVKVSKYNSRFIHFSLKFYQFFTSYFDILLLGTHTLMVVTSSWSIDPLWWCNVPLYPWKLPCSVSLYLKWVSCRQHIVESLFFNPLWQSLPTSWYV